MNEDSCQTGNELIQLLKRQIDDLNKKVLELTKKLAEKEEKIRNANQSGDNRT